LVFMLIDVEALDRLAPAGESSPNEARIDRGAHPGGHRPLGIKGGRGRFEDHVRCVLADLLPRYYQGALRQFLFVVLLPEESVHETCSIPLTEYFPIFRNSEYGEIKYAKV
jgi:hypothetical protein